MLAFKLNSLLNFCNQDPQLGIDCNGITFCNGAPSTGQQKTRPMQSYTNISSSVFLFPCENWCDSFL